MNRFSKTVFFTMVTALAGCVSAPTETASSGISSAIPAAASMGASSLGLPTAGASSSLVNVLVQQLGISPQQATGGAGSIFSLAKQVMSPSSFGQVSQSVPGMSQLLAAAPALNSSGSGAGGLLGSAAGMLGSGNSLGNMATLASSFQNLGLGSGMVSKFIPVILQYVQTQGGAGTMGLLQGALMP